ncbi:MAG: hypothetical protein ISR72_01965 [Methylobacter sp.]|nr:hypothetical protein [Methylobacter sp.]
MTGFNKRQNTLTNKTNKDIYNAYPCQHAPSLQPSNQIIATLGPSSDTAETIHNLIKAGVNVFRLNISHGEQENHRKPYHLIQESSEALHQHIAIFYRSMHPKNQNRTISNRQYFYQ